MFKIFRVKYFRGCSRKFFNNKYFQTVVACLCSPRLSSSLNNFCYKWITTNKVILSWSPSNTRIVLKRSTSLGSSTLLKAFPVYCMARNFWGIKSSLFSWILCKPRNYLHVQYYIAEAICNRSFAQGVFHRYKLRTFCGGSFKFLKLNPAKKGLSHPSGTIIPASYIDAANAQGSENNCY